MVYAALASLLPLLAPADAAGILVSLAALLGLGALINRRHKKGSEGNAGRPFRAGHLLIIIAIAIYLGYTFFIRWRASSKVAALAGMLGLSVQMFLGIVSVLLSCIAVCSMNWLFYDIKEIFFKETCLSELNQRLERADGITTSLDRNDRLVCGLLALGNAIAFCDTCPLFKTDQGTDSSVFLYIGREMLRGKVPYVDLFDHKGILLYFIQYAGMRLSCPGTYSGVWFIEWIGILITAVYLYKTVRLLTDSKRTGYLVLLVMLFPCIGVYSGGGNMTENYALPWIALAIYVYLKFFMTARYRPMEVVALGAGCAAVALLQVNMVSAWIAFTPLVMFFFLKNRQYGKLVRCSLCFIAGFAAVCIPVGLYCFLTDSMGSMIACYIRFNRDYIGYGNSIANQMTAALMLLSGFCLIPILLTVVIYRHGKPSPKGKMLFGVNMWGMAVSLLFASISGRAYAHYGSVLVPHLAVPVWLTVQGMINDREQTADTEKSTHSRRTFQRSTQVLAAMFCLSILILSLPKVIDTVTTKGADPAVVYLSGETDEGDDVLVIGNKARYYLESGRRTDNKFFFQVPPIEISDAIYQEFIEELDRKPSDVVLFETRNEKLEDLFEQWRKEGKYTCEDHGPFIVYRLQNA